MRIKIHKYLIRDIVLLLTIVGSNGFFCICTILGISYQGSENSDLFFLYNIILCFISLIFVLLNIIKHKIKIEKKFIGLVTLIMIYLLSFFLGEYRNSTSVQLVLQFGVWCIPSALIGLYYSYSLNWKEMFKYLDLLNVLYTYTAFNTALVFLRNGWQSATNTGINYQDASYIAAFAFGITLYMLTSNNNCKRFSFFYTSFSKLIYILFLLIQIISLFICGGRGALVLVLVYIIIMLIKYLDIKNFFKYLSIFILIILTLKYLIPIFGFEDQIKAGFTRATSFFYNGNIQWSHTSGRNVVYISILNGIKNNFLFGYGIFDYRNIFGLAHNFFLELLIQGGIILFIFWICLLSLLLYKYWQYRYLSIDFSFIGIILLYPIIMLFFSGSYTNNSIFWFGIGLLIGISKINPKKLRGEE